MPVPVLRLLAAAVAAPARTLAVALLLLGSAGGTARAHPHVWVIVKSEIVYADGAAVAVRHHWTFDEMFSAFAVQGLDTKKPGGLTRADLAPLAEVNVTSLKEFDFFTFAKADGKRAPFTDPKDYWLEQKDGALTLHFTLPFKAPVKARALNFEIYDNSFFVDFSLAQKDPAALVGAPAGCALTAQVPRAAPSGPQPVPDESFFQGGGAANYGRQFANRIAVTCP